MPAPSPGADEEAERKRKYRRRILLATYPSSLAEELGDRVQFIHPPRRDAPEMLVVLVLFGGCRIEDRGDHVSGWGEPQQLAADMVAVAQAKGWSSVVATGDPEFLVAVEAECQRRGLKIDLKRGQDDDEAQNYPEARPTTT